MARGPDYCGVQVVSGYSINRVTLDHSHVLEFH